MAEIKIINYIEIDGKDVRLDEQPEEEQIRICQKLQDQSMMAVGYRRKTA